MTGFKDLEVWEKSKNLTIEVYKITNSKEFNKDFGLRDHIRKTAVSVPSNIAEGDERGTNKESVRFFYIAKGSIAEIRTQLEIAHEIGYLSKEEYLDFDIKYNDISKKLGKLIKVRTSNPSPLTRSSKKVVK